MCSGRCHAESSPPPPPAPLQDIAAIKQIHKQAAQVQSLQWLGKVLNWVGPLGVFVLSCSLIGFKRTIFRSAFQSPLLGSRGPELEGFFSFQPGFKGHPSDTSAFGSSFGSGLPSPRKIFREMDTQNCNVVSLQDWFRVSGELLRVIQHTPNPYPLTYKRRTEARMLPYPLALFEGYAYTWYVEHFSEVHPKPSP